MLGYCICELAACDLWIRCLACRTHRGENIRSSTLCQAPHFRLATSLFRCGEGSAGTCNYLPFIAVGV